MAAPSCVPFGHRAGPDHFQSGLPLAPPEIGWMQPGAVCRVWGRPARIVRKSKLPRQIWVQYADATLPSMVSIALVLPDRAEFGPADPSVVLA